MRKVTYTAYNPDTLEILENIPNLDTALDFQSNPYYIETVLTDCYEKTSEGAILSLLQRL